MKLFLYFLIKILFLLNLSHTGSTEDLDNDKIEVTYPTEVKHETDFTQSSFYLNDLCTAEVKIYKALGFWDKNKNYHTSKDIGILHRVNYHEYLNSSAKLSNDYPSNISLVATNPLLIYSMLRRFAKVPPNAYNYKSFVEYLFWDKNYSWPRHKSLNSAMDNLINIYTTYDLKIKDFGQGIINGVHTQGVNFNYLDYYLIGAKALEKKKYTFSVHLLEKSMKELGNDTNANITQKLLVQNMLEKAITEHNKGVDLTSNHWNINYFEEPITHESKNRSKNRRNLKRFKAKLGDSKSKLMNMQRKGLCKGEILQTEQMRADLFCILDNSKNPFFTINPLKVEILSIYPFILQIHDFVRNKTITELLKIDNPQYPPSFYQTSAKQPLQTKLFIDKPKPPLAQHRIQRLLKLNRKIELYTGLVVNSSDPFRGFEFTPGMQSGIQIDSHLVGSKSKKEFKNSPDYHMGDRLASMMIFLSDVRMGGRVAFIQALMSVKPSKGSAIFWFNTHRNGKTDMRSYYSHCPVIFGHKKVAVKWFRANAQFKNHPCMINKNG